MCRSTLVREMRNIDGGGDTLGDINVRITGWFCGSI